MRGAEQDWIMLLMLPLLTWLVQGAVGPALVGLPVTWAAGDLAGAAKRWFRRLRRSDGLSQIVRAAAGDVDLSGAEFAEVQRLLEQEGTWALLGRGTVEDIAARIASCLPGRGEGASLAAGRAIAAGLLEFAVRDLEPAWFQRVLFARIDRLETRQASALDEALLGVHADLAALLAHRDADDVRFGRVMGQLGLALGRLPPGPAGQAEVTVYLATLVRWLNSDPWPQGTQPTGPPLTPAVIERRLRITGRRGEELDADDLAGRCARLVVLGGPGSGKTWLARRAARLCAEAALDQMAAGALPGEVELPLYTTCARLAATPPGDGIRRAVVASAFGHLPDLGGSRVADALRVLFEERNDAPVLLVMDSLDEARGADDRAQQADTLPASWRIVLTSRPGAWTGQLAIRAGDPLTQAGVLLPLRYPQDVEPFVHAWFSGRPARAASLAAQLDSRPALQRAATVPLLLTFYCIIGGNHPLPERHTVLYAKVIRRMLTGRWRGGNGRDPEWDPAACLDALRGWAWSAAEADPVSGVGDWADEFPAPRVGNRDDRDALNHVAVPLDPPDLDTGMTRRRFVHRSVQEHLAAEYVALRMSSEEAAGELLNHLWYDPDWEHAAPAALALHPKREQVLWELLRRLTGGGQLTADLTVIDGCWEIRRFLARVALESSEGDWSREAAQLIGQARTDLTTSRQGDLRLVTADNWRASNRAILEWLLAALAREDSHLTAGDLADAVARFAVSPEERAAARQALLALLTRDNPWAVGAVADTVARLDPSAEERAAALL
jgi:NACHT domain